ncbi:MAG: HPr family phosphocarrier protein [Thiotrichales bacterium]|nr:HPr family phosphocarrier protein [Thiotrichales bacterium]
MRSEVRVVVTNPTGLHARPAVKLAQLAAGFDAHIEIRAGDDGDWVRARSTARVMKLKAGAQSTIHFRAEGIDADDALSALVDFVRRDFDEGPAAALPDGASRWREDGGRDAAHDDSNAPGATPERAAANDDTSAAAPPSEPIGRHGEDMSIFASNPVAGGASLAAERAIPAVVASPGLAIGILHMPASADRADGELPARQPGTAGSERAAFDAAVARTIARLRELADAAGDLGRDVIGFQISLLEDEEFIDPVRAAIAAGAAADRAWLDHLAGEIADYESAPTAYLRDRAADLRDLRERVATAFAGNAGAGTGENASREAEGDPDAGPRTDVRPEAGPDPEARRAPEARPDPEADPNAGSEPEAGAGMDAGPDSEARPERYVMIADELTPSRFLELDRSRIVAVATRSGSVAGHAAMLARAHGVPMLVQLACDPAEFEPGTEAVVDADEGRLVLAPPRAVRERYSQRIEERRARAREAAQHASRPARTRAGVRIQVLVNVDDPTGLASVDPAHCDGIGLARTELLFHGADGRPGEQTQFECYRRLVAWANGRPVTMRTLDAGGDKPIPGLTIEGESNPFLGLRGVRLSLARPDVFATQLRALARVAAGAEVKVMLPMVTTPAEVDQVRRLLASEVRALRAAGIKAAMPRLGMMVEVPAAALTIERFDADFFSIGTNDLAQYVLAAGRDSAAVADILDPLHPAVLELIARVADAGARTGREVSVCGEMAARPECLPALIEAGIRTISVPSNALARIKAAIADL